MFKKILPLLVVITALATTATIQAKTLTVAATPLPAAELLEFVKPDLAKQGIDLQIKTFTDYIQPNAQLAAHQLDANFYQHKPFLDSYNKGHDTHLTPICAVHVIPMAVYSDKITNIDQLKDGEWVALPNDPTNNARALLLLQKQGLIELKDPNDVLATAHDIVKNPKHLKFRELEAAAVPRAMPDVTLAVINTNYALAAGLNPVKDSLFIEGKDTPYANLVVTTPDHKDDPAIHKLCHALTTEKMRHYMIKHYDGSVIPVF